MRCEQPILSCSVCSVSWTMARGLGNVTARQRRRPCCTAESRSAMVPRTPRSTSLSTRWMAPPSSRRCGLRCRPLSVELCGAAR